jgi:VanZ family protein
VKRPQFQLALPILAGALLVVSSPAIGEMRTWVRSALPARYVLLVNVTVGLLTAVSIGIAVARIRERRAWRYAALIAAVLVAAASAAATASPSASQNAVERFHFIEYGLVTFLFYRALRAAAPGGQSAPADDDVSLMVVPVFAGLLVGTADEWCQWFVPRRVGELRDVFLNGWAILAGLLFSVGIAPPARFTWRGRPGSWTRLGRTAAAFVVALAAFIHTVHLGYLIEDGEIGVFRSHETAEGLEAKSRDRTARWRGSRPPAEAPLFSREDQYVAEALFHVQARNQAWGHDSIVTWREQQILERYFAPVVALPAYAWPAEQRAEAAARAAAVPSSRFESRAEPEHYILVWSKTLFWSVAAAGIVAILLAGRVLDRRHR